MDLSYLPPFDGFVSELHPQPTDPNTTTGFVSVSDLEAIFRRVYDQLRTQRAVIQGWQSQVFAAKGLVTAADPRDLHSPVHFPRPGTTYSGAPWMYLLRYAAQAPDQPPEDGPYTVGQYYNNLISMWVWSPLPSADPWNASQDALVYGENTRPGLPGLASATWPSGTPLPVFTRVGPWLFLCDLSEVAQSSMNSVLRGAQWFTSHGEPGTLEGAKPGDYCLDLDTGDVYGQVLDAPLPP